MVRALKQSGYHGLVVSFTTLMSQETIDSLGDDAKGIIVVGQFVPATSTDNEGIQQFLTDVKKLDPDAEKTHSSSELALQAWASVRLFEAIATQLDKVTNETVLEALNNLKDPIDLHVVAPYKVVGQTSPIKTATRIFNPTMVYNKVENGALKQVTGFENPFPKS